MENKDAALPSTNVPQEATGSPDVQNAGFNCLFIKIFLLFFH